MMLIACGMVCILATLGVAAFVVSLVFRDSALPFRGVEDWYVPFLFVSLAIGLGMIVTGTVLAARRSN
jgi:hypothetical protein